MYTRTRLALLATALVVMALPISSLGCAKKSYSDQAAIVVNNYKMTAGEFNNLYSKLNITDDSPEKRKAFLDNLINRKLLLQEAQRRGLDKKPDFLQTIENFWEQSLLKVVVDEKTKEINQNIMVSDQEISNYYEQWSKANPKEKKSLEEMRSIIVWNIQRQKQAAALDTWLEGLAKKAKIKVSKKALAIE